MRKTAYDLLRSVYEKTRETPRGMKYTPVKVLKKDLTEIVVVIYRTNATTGKPSYIERIRDLVVEVEARLRLLQDTRHVSVKQYAAFVQQVESLPKQLSA